MREPDHTRRVVITGLGIVSPIGNTVGDVVTVDMAKAAIETSGKRAKAGQQVDADELNAEHKKDLPGDKLDPNLLVDPVTLAPAAAK